MNDLVAGDDGGGHLTFIYLRPRAARAHRQRDGNVF